jgi:hypothetical protein
LDPAAACPGAPGVEMGLKQFKRIAFLRLGLHGIRSSFARFLASIRDFLAKDTDSSTQFHSKNPAK